MDFEDLPILPQVIYEELKKNYDTGYLLKHNKDKSADYQIGYMQAISDILGNLRVLARLNE